MRCESDAIATWPSPDHFLVTYQKVQRFCNYKIDSPKQANYSAFRLQLAIYADSLYTTNLVHNRLDTIASMHYSPLVQEIELYRRRECVPR